MAIDPAYQQLRDPSRPDAVFCMYERLGVEVLRAARDAGLSVPADLRVAAISEMGLAESSEPPLTTLEINPDELVKEGLQALVRGDTKAALALCKRVTQANQSYASAWRLMGLVYEKLGEKASAHNAFQKYLQLAPGASDAPSIRQHLESL